MHPFDFFPSSIKKILIEMEERDWKEREAGLGRFQRLRQIPRETGEFLFQFLTIFSYQNPNFLGLEIGTSGGYSTIWQGMGLKTNGCGKLISIDLDPKKYKLASENIASTEVNKHIELILGDAKEYLKKTQERFSYIFMDCEKEDYVYFFKMVVDRLTSGNVLIADNVISHQDNLQDFIQLIQNDARVSSIIIPIGKGLAFLRWV